MSQAKDVSESFSGETDIGRAGVGAPELKYKTPFQQGA